MKRKCQLGEVSSKVVSIFFGGNYGFLRVWVLKDECFGDRRLCLEYEQVRSQIIDLYIRQEILNSDILVGELKKIVLQKRQKEIFFYF